MAVLAGAIAGSISLVGYGIDSFIEVTSGSVFRSVVGDPAAALIMVPIIAKEGIQGLQGKACQDCS